MKLLSCIIQGFGKLRSVRLDFTSNLTCICEENGYGKTTLAAFLKAMFYGMDSSTKKSKFNDRAHYLPFDGGPYGGTVIFEYKGVRYRLKRAFDPSSAAKDFMEITPDRENAPALEDPVGEKIFGIDKDSFERTIFITSQEIELSSTENIKTRLNNFVEGTSDDTNLQQALKKLDTRAREYSYKSGKAGLIYDEKAKADKTRIAIANRNAISGSLAEKYERLEGYDRQIAGLRMQVSNAQTENTLRADWDHYDELAGAARTAKESYNEICSRYPYGIPEVDEVNAARRSLAACETAHAVLQKKTFTAEDEAQLAAYNREFAGGVPKDEYLSSLADRVHKAQETENEIAALSARTPTETETALKKRFDGRLPDASAIDALNSYEEQYRQADAAISSAPVPVPKSNSNRMLQLILLITGIVVLIAGIGVCFAQVTAGVILIVVGVVALVADVILYLSKRTSKAHSEGSLNSAREKRDELSNRIGAIIMPYGYSFEGGVLFGISSFKKDLEAYGSYLSGEMARQEEIAAKQRERSDIVSILSSYFNRFGISGEPITDWLPKLRGQINAYNTLRERKASSDKDERETYASLKNSQNAVIGFCNRYGLPSDNTGVIRQELDEAEEDSRRASGYIDAYNDSMAKANEFMARKNLGVRPEGDSVDIDTINAKITGLQAARSALAIEIGDAEKDIESKDGLENDLADCNDRIARYTANYGIILKTMDALKAADDRLKDKYANPISGSFDRYEKTLQKTTGEKIYMTRDLNVRFEHAGMEKGEEYLSAGQRAACALCYRLAILDNMYSGEKPFLILDDPFSSMDEGHLASSKALLIDLSRSFQIIYLTCHESRMI
ncbi:MAG: AAA family ATPase [Clostridia bacterium]|nr:AAA family ATPase [Clostridia bacterium]